ncbi:hypothetical protein SZ29_15000 [Burkholderia pseudomallei]|nr:hypothetical protein SZ29_15000 [Burkholderia pseudomallei]
MRGSRASRHGRGRDVRDRHVRDRHVPLTRGGRLRARFGKMRVSGARSRRRVASFWYPTRS